MFTSREKTAFDALGKWLYRFGHWASEMIKRRFGSWTVPHNSSRDWLDDADWARLQQEPLRARALLYVIAAALLLLLLWAAFASVDEVARGEGRVIPSRQLQVVQSFDGGVVEEILVREGQVVAEGDLLLRIDPTRFVSSFRENRAQFLSLQARAARLQSLVSGHEQVTFSAELLAEAPELADQEKNLFAANRRELNEQITIANNQLQQRQEELNEVRAKRTQARRALELINQELGVTRPLLASGAISEVEVLRLEREAARAQGELQQSEAQLLRVQAAVAESEGKLRELELVADNKWRSELSETLGKLSTLAQSGVGLADRIKHAEIRAPVRGTVQRLFVTTLGAVIQPGREVLEMVPLDDQLLIEAKVSPRDIAFLHPGQAAIVKFTAYDFVVYGGLSGVLEHISPDTITDERDNTFYLVRVRTDRSGFNPSLPIIPGMTTQVDILTGKKTILSYLLKPVLRARQNALTER